MQNELFEIKFFNERNAIWQEPAVLQSKREGGLAAYKFSLTGDQFEMDFINTARSHYDIWYNKYLNDGNAFTTETYIPGPLIELGFSLENNGAMDLKNIGSVTTGRLQYFLTALPY